MLFNSFEFLVFFAVVYGGYLLLKHPWQNRLLIVASILFYATFSWPFLALMFASISVDFFCSHLIDQSNKQAHRRVFLIISVVVNLLILGFFKYYNFFISNITSLLAVFHINASLATPLSIVLPLGISFYTFEAISYVVDVYRGVVKPAKRYWDYVLFVIYFPHLIAGPIMRAKSFIPQVINPRQITLAYFYEGCYLFFWGIFEKVFVADNLAKIVNPVFANSTAFGLGEIVVALWAFAFQIFCDFDGYSNMARGLGKMMGFDIAINFNLPYFATNPQDFWRRWHITLSTWLRDYVYIPLGGNKTGGLGVYGNIALTMLIGGLWHGASWVFVLWGAYQGAILCAYRFLATQKFVEVVSQKIPRLVKIAFMFQITALGWLFFRASSLDEVGQMFSVIATSGQWVNAGALYSFFKFMNIIFPLIAVQIGQYVTGDLMFLTRRHWLIKIVVYAWFLYLIVGWGVMKPQEFFYFQF